MMETHKAARPTAKRRPRRRGGRATRFGDFVFLKTDSQFAFKVGETASRLVKRGHPRKVFLRILGGRELTTELES